MNKSNRTVMDNICNIFTLLSVIMLLYAGFIAINEHMLDKLIWVEKMKITSIEKRSDLETDDYMPEYKIEVKQNINGHDYVTYISRIPTGYTDRTKNDDKTSEYKVGDMAEVYIDSSTMTDNDFDIIYNISLFRSGIFGYVSSLPLTVAVICFVLGLAKITKIVDFCLKHRGFVGVSLLFSLVTNMMYLMWENTLRQNSTMFRGLGEGLILNGLLLIGLLVYFITSICLIVSDHKKSCISAD